MLRAPPQQVPDHGHAQSAPAIFHEAIVEHGAYNQSLETTVRAGLAAHEIREALVIEDIRAAAAAFIAGMEDRVASVASFFLSCIDTLVDQRLEQVSDPELKAPQGDCAIACAQAACSH